MSESRKYISFHAAINRDGHKIAYFEATSGAGFGRAVSDIKKYLKEKGFTGEYDFIFNDVVLHISQYRPVESLWKEYMSLLNVKSVDC